MAIRSKGTTLVSGGMIVSRSFAISDIAFWTLWFIECLLSQKPLEGVLLWCMCNKAAFNKYIMNGKKAQQAVFMEASFFSFHAKICSAKRTNLLDILRLSKYNYT